MNKRTLTRKCKSKSKYSNYSYQDFIDSYNDLDDTIKRGIFKTAAKYRFPDAFNDIDFPRKKSKYSDFSYQDFIDAYQNKGGKFKVQFFRMYAERLYPDVYDPVDFKLNKLYHDLSYEEIVNVANKQDTKVYTLGRIKKIAIERFPYKFKEKDFPTKLRYKLLSYEDLSKLHSNSSENYERGNIKTAAKNMFGAIYNDEDFKNKKESPRFSFMHIPYEVLVEVHNASKSYTERYSCKTGIIRNYPNQYKESDLNSGNHASYRYMPYDALVDGHNSTEVGIQRSVIRSAMKRHYPDKYNISDLLFGKVQVQKIHMP